MTLTINFLGNVYDDLDFSNTSGAKIQGGCAASLRGTMWYFGGFDGEYHRQVSLKAI